VECMYCKKQFPYQRNRCFEHYPYQAKIQRIIYTMMPMVVRWRFQNCGNVVPTRMAHMEIYGTLATSFEATQPVKILSSISQYIPTEMGVFSMAMVVQCKSHWNHAKNVVAVIHLT
jgi:hypothetical protein